LGADRTFVSGNSAARGRDAARKIGTRKIGTGIILGTLQCLSQSSASPDLLKKQGLRLRDVADVPLKPQRRTEVRRLDMMVSLGELLIPTE